MTDRRPWFPTIQGLPDTEASERGGQPLGIISQKHAANQILAGCHRASCVGALVPDLLEREALSRIEGKEPKGPEKRLASKPAPDGPAPRVGNLEIGGGGPPQELQSHRHLAGVGDGEDERHRRALTGADRCLQCQTELGVLRQRLSG